MYCSNCGKKVDPKAVVCVGCGCSLKKRGNGFGIASMILGLVGLFYALCAFSRVIDLGSYLDYQTISYQIGFSIGFFLVQSILSIVWFSLCICDRKNNKTGFNLAGLILTSITFVIVVIQFIVVATY